MFKKMSSIEEFEGLLRELLHSDEDAMRLLISNTTKALGIGLTEREVFAKGYALAVNSKYQVKIIKG